MVGRIRNYDRHENAQDKAMGDLGGRAKGGGCSKFCGSVMRIEDHDHGGAGEVVFYAHGSESMRTYLGLSKFHAKVDCAALTRRGGTIVKDRMVDVAPSQRCKVCYPNKKSA